MLVVRLLGQFSVRLDDAPVELSLRSAQSLLAYLALTAGTTHRREKLAGLFWPDAPEASARQNLRQALWHLRRALGAREQAFLLADSHSLSFNPVSDLWLDAAALQQAVDPNAPIDALIQAVSAYGGDLLPGFYDDWVALERDHLAGVFERQMQQLLERLEAERVWPVLAAWAEKWLAFGQVPEPAYRALMLARAAQGDLAGAAATYQRCVADLDRDLGVEPSAQTRALFEQLRQGHLPGETPAPPAGLEARYELREEVGRGAMGVVHRAHDRLLDRDVAVKLLSHTGLGTSGRAQLLREAQAAARLQHPNIVAVFDAGDFNGTPAIVMELVDGPTLERRAPLATDVVIRVGSAVAAALAHAHHHNVLHRDVKPGNIVIGADGAAKLMDFGLAHSAANSYLPHEELPAGTALYMATEVLRGERATEQADLYALGATLYELAAGRPPFVGEDLPALISQHLHAPPSPPSQSRPGLPPALDDLVVRLLSKDPHDRPASAADVQLVLERLARGEAVDVEAPAPGEPPYRGLEAFDEADADWFFGRESLVAKLVGRLREQRLLAVVVGASGSGKSSVVRAGLVPALRRGAALAESSLPPPGSTGWPVHVITPTAQPLQALAESLASDSESVTATLTLLDDLAADPRSLHMFVRRRLASQPNAPARLVLVVDQFEELFTLCRDEDDRRAFIDNLLYAAASATDGPTVVILTLRADFYTHCAAYPNLREALVRHQEYIGPMSADELRRAIEAPAERGGWVLEGGLLELLLKDVGDEPGALPLLSHALLETWRRRRGRMLTLSGYAASGGVRGAIAQTAETVYAALIPTQQAIARNLFLRLTELGEGTQDTRRRATRAELTPRLEDQTVVDEVLHLLSQARLITAGHDTVEVAHEALIREWPTLRQWLSENRDALRLHRHLTEAAAEWQQRRRDPGELYRGARLAQTLEWADFSAQANNLNALEREFLTNSQEAAELETTEREAQRQRELEAAQQLALAARRETAAAQREAAIAQQLTVTEQRSSRDQARANTVLRRLAVGLAVLLLFAAIAGGLAWQQSARAQRETHLARAHQWAAEAVNQLPIDPERGIWLALYALEEGKVAGQSPLLEAEEALHRAVQSQRILYTLPPQPVVQRLRLSADNQRLTVLTTSGSVTVWHLSAHSATVQQSYQLTLTGMDMADLDLLGQVNALSADGTILAVVTSDTKTVGLWDSLTGEHLQVLGGASGTVTGLMFSYNGNRLAAITAFNTVVIWDTHSGEMVNELRTLYGFPFAISPDGRSLAIRSESYNTVSLFDVDSGDFKGRLGVHAAQVESVAYSPDGRFIATGSFDRTTRIWDAASGVLINVLYGPDLSVGGVIFSPNGRQLALLSGDGSVQVWDPVTARQLFALVGNSGPIQGMIYSPDSNWLTTVGIDDVVRVWDMAPGHEWLTLNVNEGAHNSRGDVRISFVEDLAFSPTNEFGQVKLAASVQNLWEVSQGGAGYNSSVYLWDAQTGAQLEELLHSARVVGVAFSPDGRQLATASDDKYPRLWDAQSTERLETFPYIGLEEFMGGIAFHPAGTRVAVSGSSGTVYLWDLELNETIFTVQTISMDEALAGRPYLRLAFSPDGAILATAGPDSQTRLFDANSGALLQVLAGHLGQVLSLAFSPDGRTLATGSEDATIIIWDLETAQAVTTLRGHSQGIFGVAFSPDGSLLASGGMDGMTKLWDVELRQERVTLGDLAGIVQALGYSPDGRYVAAGSTDGTLRIYLPRLEDLIELARSRVTRTLTTEECQQYLRLERCPPLPGATNP